MRLILVVLILVVLAAGCESSSKGSVKAPEETSAEAGSANVGEQAQAQEDNQANTDAQGSQGSQAGSPAVPESTPQPDGTIIGGNTEYSLDSQSIGNGIRVPSLVVNDIRWRNHGEYFRIVFELKNADGSDVTYVPNCLMCQTDPMGIIVDIQKM